MSNVWKYHDNKMIELKQLYNRTSKQTQNRLQEIFDSFNFTSEKIYNITDKQTKKRIDTYIEEWKDKGLLKGYFGMIANNIYRRSRVKNNEILELLIYSAYIEEQEKIKDPEQQIMYEDANYYYQEGQKEVNNTLKKKKPISVLDMALFLALLEEANVKGYIWNQYIEAIIKFNADQIYRQSLIDIQQQKKPDITNYIYKNIIKKQENTKININGEKISGEADLTLVGIDNKAKLEGIKELDNKAKCKFIAIEDEVTTKMCRSLDGQEFYIDDWNEFERYSEENKGIRKYKCKGLVEGLNLPPVNDHFHWCRSYIIYVSEKLDVQEDEELEESLNEFIAKLKDKYYKKTELDIDIHDLVLNAFYNEHLRDIALKVDIKKIYKYNGKTNKTNGENIILSTKNYFDRDVDSQKKTIRHEVGHIIDKQHNRISNELVTAMEKDCKLIMSNPKENRHLLRTKYSTYNEFSDIAEAITDGKVKGFTFRTKGYWDSKERKQREVFANFTSIMGGENMTKILAVQQCFPNTFEKYCQIIERIK